MFRSWLARLAVVLMGVWLIPAYFITDLGSGLRFRTEDFFGYAVIGWLAIWIGYFAVRWIAGEAINTSEDFKSASLSVKQRNVPNWAYVVFLVVAVALIMGLPRALKYM